MSDETGMPRWALEAAASCWPETDDENAGWPDPQQVLRVAEAIYIATIMERQRAIDACERMKAEADRPGDQGREYAPFSRAAAERYACDCCITAIRKGSK